MAANTHRTSINPTKFVKFFSTIDLLGLCFKRTQFFVAGIRHALHVIQIIKPLCTYSKWEIETGMVEAKETH